MPWIRESCRAHHGPLASVGTLALDAAGLHFSPEGSLDRLVGLPALALPLARIEQVALKGLERMLHVQCDGEVWRFAGDGARRVGRLLAHALAGRAPAPVLVSGEATLAGTGRVDVFVGLDDTALVDAAHPLDAPLERRPRSDGAHTRGLPPRLVLGEGPGAWRLSGGGVAQLAAALLMPGPAHSPPVFVEGALQSGLLAHPGLIAIGDGGLVFAPGGLLDQLLGAAPEAWPWRELRGIERRSGGVVFEMHDGPVVLSTHDTGSLWTAARAALDAWMAARAGQGQGFGAAPPPGGPERDRLRGCAPALWTDADDDAPPALRCANLEQRGQALVLVEPSGRGQALDRAALLRGTAPGELREGGLRIFLPPGVVAAWGLGARSTPAGTVRRFARLSDASGRVLATADAVTVAELVGLEAVALPGRPPGELRPGMRIQLELGGGAAPRREGLVVATLEAADGGAGWRLLFAPGLDSQAAAPRVLPRPLDATVARLGADGRLIDQPISAEVVELARGGATLCLARAVSPGARLRVVLSLPAGPVRLSARVDRADRRSGRHHAVLGFVSLSESVLQALDTVVVATDFEGLVD